MIKFGLIFCALLVYCYGLKLKNMGPLGTKLRNFHPVHKNHITISPLPHGLRTIRTNHPCGAHHLHFEIRTGSDSTKMELELNDRLFHENSTVSYYNQDGLMYTIRPTIVAYTGAGSSRNLHRLTLTDPDNNIWSGYFIHDDQIYFLSPASEYQAELAPLRKRGLAEDFHMVLHTAEDFLDQDDVFCGVMRGDSKIGVPQQELHPLRKNPVDSLKKEAKRVQAGNAGDDPDCPTTRKRLFQSVAADHTFTSANDEAATVQSAWNQMTGVYESTVNVEITIDEQIFLTSRTSDTWNSMTDATNCNSISQTLYDFSQWRGTRSTAAGLWMLLTECYQSGTVGLAWLSQLCVKEVRLQNSNEYVSGTAVSSYISNGWRVIAHETGHNFGSGHTSDGIMIASNIGVNWFSADSQSQMCSQIKTVLAETYIPNCLVDGASSCPDGIVQAGEDCDCGANCATDPCCTDTCTLQPAKDCLTGACCDTNTCLFRTGGVCASNSSCSDAISCDGTSRFCPAPTSVQTDPYKNSTCVDANGLPAQCYNGICGGGCFGLPEIDKFWCVQSCEKIGLANGGTYFLPCPGTECWLACSSSTCTAPDQCCDVNLGQIGFALPQGTPCSTGVCDGRGSCVIDVVSGNNTRTTPTALPPNTTYVLTPAACPNDCNTHGDCIGQTCVCYEGYRGVSCSFGPIELEQNPDNRTETGTVSLDSPHYYLIRSLERNQNVSLTITGSPFLYTIYKWNSIATNTTNDIVVVPATGASTWSGTTDYPSSTSDLYITIYGTTSSLVSYRMSYNTNRKPAFLSSVLSELATSFVGTKAFWTVIGVVGSFIVIGISIIVTQIILKRRTQVV